jgi:hypothetical protein
MDADSQDLKVLSARGSNGKPVSTETAPAWVKGIRGKRLIVIFRGPGCTYDLRPGGGCRYCGFRRLTTEGVRVESADLIAQFGWVKSHVNFSQETAIEMDLYNSGSFLNDLEVPSEARLEILREVGHLPGVRVVVIESRPEYITRPSLLEARRALMESVALEVAIGLDAYDNELREQLLQKGFTRTAFEQAVGRLAEVGADLLCYVMIKPWSMTDDAALQDAIHCAEYAHEVASRHSVRCRIALEPTFVVPGTSLADLYIAGLYEPVSLWVVRQAAERIAALGSVYVGLWDENLHPLAVPSSCVNCQRTLLGALQQFNATQDRSDLKVAPCECHG